MEFPRILFLSFLAIDFLGTSAVSEVAAPAPSSSSSFLLFSVSSSVSHSPSSSLWLSSNSTERRWTIQSLFLHLFLSLLLKQDVARFSLSSSQSLSFTLNLKTKEEKNSFAFNNETAIDSEITFFLKEKATRKDSWPKTIYPFLHFLWTEDCPAVSLLLMFFLPCASSFEGWNHSGNCSRKRPQFLSKNDWLDSRLFIVCVSFWFLPFVFIFFFFFSYRHRVMSSVNSILFFSSSSSSSSQLHPKSFFLVICPLDWLHLWKKNKLLLHFFLSSFCPLCLQEERVQVLLLLHLFFLYEMQFSFSFSLFNSSGISNNTRRGRRSDQKED